MARPIVTLTTDFGLSDHFTGTMKGVILRLCPSAALVDITHQVRPFEIAEAAFVIGEAYRYFPSRTVHLVVIDPGVGTARRPIVAEAAGQFFVAPDNGVLSMIYEREEHKVHAVTSEKHFLRPVSRTFHGRDIFAPTAALLAKRAPPARFGRLIKDYCRLRFAQPVRTGKNVWQGAVLKTDRFGNLITNLHIAGIPVLETRPFQFLCGRTTLTRLSATFAEGAPGEPLLVVGSSGYLEIVANQASAAEILGCSTGSPVELTIW